MIRYIIPLLLSASCLAQSTNEEHQLLWEISGNDLDEPSFLYGSLHSNDKRLFKFSDSTYYALDKASMIVLETDAFELFDSWDTRRGSISVKYDNEGNPYNHSTEASETLYGDEDGMPQFLDAYFEQYCFNANKKFFPLESLDFQLNLFSETKIPELSDLRLESLLTTKEGMIELYLRGDIYRLDELLKSSLSMYPKGHEKLIIDRNVNMVEHLDSLLKIDKDILFCAVGAGHLAGNHGLINLLRGKGYNMRRVSATYSEVEIPEKLEVLSHKEYLYKNEKYGLTVKFPGKPKSLDCEKEDCELKLIYRDLGQGNTYQIEIYARYEGANLEEFAQNYIASPSESPMRRLEFDDGTEAFEGMADSYPEGLYWTRVIMNELQFCVIKSYGGNKFMNSKRAQKFFHNTWLD